MQDEKAVTGRIVQGKLLRIGPITTSPEIQAEVGGLKSESQGPRECTCEFCRTSHTRNPTIPVLR